jgi:hypothetical protein
MLILADFMDNLWLGMKCETKVQMSTQT